MFLLVLGLAFEATPRVIAQTMTTTVIWGRNLPHVDVTIVNETSDGAPLQASVNHEYLRGLLDKGEQHIWRFDQTAWGWNGPMKVEMRIEVCSSVMPSAATPLFTPPEWAMNRAFLGNLAITDSFLHSDPGERALRGRVDAIKQFLDERRELGRKQMEKDLDRWLKFCKKYGSRSMGPSCAGVAQRFIEPVDVTQYWGQRPYIIKVVGEDGDYSLVRSNDP